MRRTFFFLTLLFFAFALSAAQESSTNRTQGTTRSSIDRLKPKKWGLKTILGGHIFSEPPDTSHIFRFSLHPEALFELHPYLTLKGSLLLNLESSRIQSRFEDSTAPLMEIEELILSLATQKPLSLNLGVLSQKKLGSLYTESISFPGIELKTHITPITDLNLDFSAQYTIPTSSSFDDDRISQEKLPSFQTVGGNLSWKASPWFLLNSQAHYFSFQNLPSKTAFHSRLLGNSVSGISPSESHFAYEFQGFLFKNSMSLPLHQLFKPTLSLQIVENLKAPSDRRRSQNLKAQIEAQLKSLKISPSLSLYYNESDAFPAFYSQSRYGGNNRQGTILGLSLELIEYGLFVHLENIESTLIEKSSFQNELSYWSLQLEVVHETF